MNMEKTQKENSFYELRLRRELRREREDRRFWEQATLAVSCVAAMMAGVLLAVVSAVGII